MGREPGPRSDARRLETAYESSPALPGRLRRVLDAIVEPGRSALLIGEPGTGKRRLAEETAWELAQQRPDAVEVTVMSPPSDPLRSGVGTIFSFYFPEILHLNENADVAHAVPGPYDLARELLAAIETAANGKHPVLVIPEVDRFPPVPAFMLEYLARSRRVTILATAGRLVGAAERLARDPGVRQIAVGPLTLEETSEYLVRMLGVERIAPDTLQRWHAATAGNAYSLALLALSSERQSLLKRNRGMAWVPLGSDPVPTEFADYLHESCSPAEIETLEMVSLAEPVFEPELLRTLDAVALEALLERGVLVSRSRSSGEVALALSNSLYAASIRERMSPLKRLQWYDKLFCALAPAAHPQWNGTAPGVPMHPERVLRLVVFGLECGRSLPASWLWQSLQFAEKGVDPRLLLRIALVVAESEDPAQAGFAALCALEVSHLMGDAQQHTQARERLTAFVSDPTRMAAADPALRASMRLAEIMQRLGTDEFDDLLKEFDQLEATLQVQARTHVGHDPDNHPESVALQLLRSSRMRIFAYTGRLGSVLDSCPGAEQAQNIEVEWARVSARTCAALVLQQRGQLRAALQSAETARRLLALSDRHLLQSLDLQGFSAFLAYWVSGNQEGAKHLLADIEQHSSVHMHLLATSSGLISTGHALVALGDGRWQDAAGMCDRLVAQLTRHDPLGILPLLHAIDALALAALGQRSGALAAMRSAESDTPGLAQALGGYVGVLVLHAAHWLRDPSTEARALRLAEWAEREDLALIELFALHTAAACSHRVAEQVLLRARYIAELVDPPLGNAILDQIAHIAEHAAMDETTVRYLADLGVWTPLPESGQLSSREREVALLASLGYSNRVVADRLYLSVRTVETHLRHVYDKIGVTDRDELRRWFARDRFQH
ncbi:LuxR C-terminal-related transcriptional regulator [Leucobacter sp. GX24907]